MSGYDRAPNDGGTGPNTPAIFDRACPGNYVPKTRIHGAALTAQQALAKSRGFQATPGGFLRAVTPCLEHLNFPRKATLLDASAAFPLEFHEAWASIIQQQAQAELLALPV